MRLIGMTATRIRRLVGHVGLVGLMPAATLGACTAPAAPVPTPAPSLTTGVHGKVMIDGGCPVIRAESPCPDKPYQARIVVRRTGTETGVATVTSDPGGAFSVGLPPGSYTLLGQNLTGAALPQAAPVEATVPAAGFAEVTISFDSGIR